jgi:hypothetical protein
MLLVMQGSKFQGTGKSKRREQASTPKNQSHPARHSWEQKEGTHISKPTRSAGPCTPARGHLQWSMPVNGYLSSHGGSRYVYMNYMQVQTFVDYFDVVTIPASNSINNDGIYPPVPL